MVIGSNPRREGARTRRSAPLGIRLTLWLCVALTGASTVLAAAALHGYDVFRQAQNAEAVRARTLAEAYAGQLAGHAGDSAYLQGMSWHPAVRLLAVVDAQQKVLAVRGATELLELCLKHEPSASGTWRMAEAGELPELYWATVRLPPSAAGERRIVCAVQPIACTPQNAEQVWTFCVRMLMIAGTGLLMGIWWLWRSVVTPLRLLAEQARGGKPVPATRSDEIGQLARNLREMRIGLEEWRQRATRLERSVSQRVQAETSRVCRELQQTRRAIWTDPLTGLGNRGLLEDRFDALFRVQRATGQELCVIMLDLDNFKHLNDALGHQAGDDLLRFMGKLLSHGIREQDLAVRYGGDEFTVVLPSVGLKDATRIAQRMVLLFRQQSKLVPVEPRPSISAGLASLSAHQPRDPETLLKLADAALYAAKRAGKDTVQVYAPEEPEPVRPAPQHVG